MMAANKKSVDDTPICDPAYLRRIDPVWMLDRVPRRFWGDPTHRRDYLLWLAGRLGFHKMSDFYGLCLSKVRRRNRGRGLTAYWGHLGFRAVQDCFPDYDWKPWLFPHVPPGFWDSPINRQSYMVWLGEELRFRRPEDWCRIETGDFLKHGGLTLLRRYASLYDLMREFLPEIAWDRLAAHRPLAVEEILAWADAYHSRDGTWPTCGSGRVPESGDDWGAIDKCLHNGDRGLAGGTSLAKLLEKHRGIRAGKRPPRLSEEQILAWADAYFAQNGKWPSCWSGPIPGTRETWLAVHNALCSGGRGIGPGSSLAQLLAERRAKRNHLCLSPLTEEQILAWADAFYDAQGKWPTKDSGSVPDTQETWSALDASLRVGRRGVGPDCSLARLLAERRGKRNHLCLSPLTKEQILAWADAYFAAHGKWPNEFSGPIAGGSENWRAVASAMRQGGRGLRRRLSLAQLLAQRRGVRNQKCLPPLSEKQILAWADAYFTAHGKWPTEKSGPIAGAKETWSIVAEALRGGGRGLRRQLSLAQLLAQRRGARNPKRPPLREAKILAWAHRYFKTNGRWPSMDCGPIPQSPGDTWHAVESALRNGQRGLPGGSSLARLLKQHGLV